MAEVMTAFPFASYQALVTHARELRVHRPRKPYRKFGVPALDEVRAECFRRKITMGDLDAISQGKGYFVNVSRDRHNGFINFQAVARAVKALGGELHVVWRHESG